MKRLLKAILKTIGFLAIASIISSILLTIMILIPWITDILFALSIISLIIIYYLKEEEDS